MFSSFAKQDDESEGLVLGLVMLALLVISLPALFHTIGA
jgi:hypothetical protein